MSDQYRDSCVNRQNKKRKVFKDRTNDPIRISFYDKDGMRVNDVTRSEANCIATLDPSQLFYFQDGDGYQRELLITEVNNLDIPDALPASPAPCPTNPQFCGPPKVQFFGGMGMGAMANVIVSPNSSSVIGFDILNPGFNYVKPPFAQLIDECGNGSGGKLFVRTKPYDGKKDPGRKSGTKGGLEVKDIVITAPGDGYLPAPDGSKGGNGRVTDPAPDPNDPTPALPIVTFTASKYLINSTEEVTLLWSTQNVTTVNITEVGNNLTLIGSQKVTIDRTKTYTLTATGPGGSKTSKVTISLIPTLPPEPPVPDPARPPSVTFISSKYEVNDGEEFELTWQTSNANTITIDGGIGNVDKNGKRTLTIEETTTYTLTAVGAGGTTTQKVTVIYKSPVPPIPPVPPAPPVPPIPPVPPAPPVPPIPPVPPVPPVGTTYKVLMCLDDIYLEDGGFGYVPGDTARVVPENGSQVELEINERGEIVSIKVLSKGCGYTDLPEIVIESQTGYNAKLYPVLSATRITDEQALFDIPPQVELVSVVDCVGVVPPKKEFDRVPR
jgi:hypothetical protein